MRLFQEQALVWLQMKINIVTSTVSIDIRYGHNLLNVWVASLRQKKRSKFNILLPNILIKLTY